MTQNNSRISETKYDLLKTELLLTQQQMDKYDQLSSTTKTWAVTLWVATVGWTVQTHAHNLILVGIVIALFFWFFDASNKRYRQDYKNRRNEVAKALSSYSDGINVEAIFTPKLPTHEESALRSSVFLVHVGLPYITLLVLSIAVYILI